MGEELIDMSTVPIRSPRQFLFAMFQGSGNIPPILAIARRLRGTRALCWYSLPVPAYSPTGRDVLSLPPSLKESGTLEQRSFRSTRRMIRSTVPRRPAAFLAAGLRKGSPSISSRRVAGRALVGAEHHA